MIPNVAAPTPRRKRRLPTPNEAFAGIQLALENAERHLRCADLLAGKGEYGQALAHLVLSLEETDKARVLGMLWLDEGDLTEEQARARLFDHRIRNEAAFAKSWTIGMLLTAAAEALTDQATGGARRSDAELLAAAMAQHPEALPADWPETAGRAREAGLYVDMDDNGTWHTPRDVTEADIQRFKPAAEGLLNNAKLAFARHQFDRARTQPQT